MSHLPSLYSNSANGNNNNEFIQQSHLGRLHNLGRRPKFAISSIQNNPTKSTVASKHISNEENATSNIKIMNTKIHSADHKPFPEYQQCINRTCQSEFLNLVQFYRSLSNPIPRYFNLKDEIPINCVSINLHKYFNISESNENYSATSTLMTFAEIDNLLKTAIDDTCIDFGRPIQIDCKPIRKFDIDELQITREQLIIPNSNNTKHILIVGDVHGDLNQFIIPLIYHLQHIDETILIYVGDYVDRGESIVYIYEIMRFIESNPNEFKYIYFIRGNHDGTYSADHGTIPTGSTSTQLGNSFMLPLLENMHMYNIITIPSKNILISHGNPTLRPANGSKQYAYAIGINPTEKLKNVVAICKNTYNSDLLHFESTHSAIPDISKLVTYIHGHDHAQLYDAARQYYTKGNYNVLYDMICSSCCNNRKRYLQIVCGDISVDFDVNYRSSNISRVAFLELHFDDDDQILKRQDIYLICCDRIQRSIRNDFNSMPFSCIKNILKYYNNTFDTIDLTYSYTYFLNKLLIPNKLSVPSKIIDGLYKNTEFNMQHIYFQDVPFEFYKQLNILDLPDDHVPPLELYAELSATHVPLPYKQHKKYSGGQFNISDKPIVFYIVLALGISIVIIAIVVAIVVVSRKSKPESFSYAYV